VVPPSEWLREEKRWGCLGTAYDYLVGVRVAGKRLTPVFKRVKGVAPSRLVEVLKTLLAKPPRWRRAPRRRDLDYYRGLGALADMDAMYRRVGVEPAALLMRPRIRTMARLRAALREEYPDEFVEEVQALVAVSREDLPRGKPTIYNPIFNGMCGSVYFNADGDLLVGDLLLDLKVSVELFKGIQLWQLLGYTALDRVNGEDRIRRVGLYNPRYQALWAAPLQDVLHGMGGTTWEAFYEWFQREVTGAICRAVAPAPTDLR
jgi:hypothetical protein